MLDASSAVTRGERSQPERMLNLGQLLKALSKLGEGCAASSISTGAGESDGGLPAGEDRTADAGCDD